MYSELRSIYVTLAQDVGTVGSHNCSIKLLWLNSEIAESLMPCSVLNVDESMKK